MCSFKKSKRRADRAVAILDTAAPISTKHSYEPSRKHHLSNKKSRIEPVPELRGHRETDR